MKKLLLLILFISFNNKSFPQLLKSVNLDAGKVTSVCFLTNKPEIALGTTDGVIKFYDYKNHLIKKKLKSRYDDIIKLISDPDNTKIYVLHEGKGTGSTNNTFNYWDLNNYSEHVLFQMSNFIQGFDFYNDNNSAVFNTVTIKYRFDSWNNRITRYVISEIYIYDGIKTEFQKYEVESFTSKREDKKVKSDAKDYEEYYWYDLKNLDNNRILLYGLQSDFLIYDLNQRKVVSDLISRNKLEATEFDVSPDKTRLVNASYSKENWIYLWDIPTGKSINTLKGHKSLVLTVSFSPDGKYIASGDEDGKVILWEVSTGNSIGKIDAHNKDVNQIRFSPDGSIFVTCSDDGSAKIWDAIKLIPDLKVFSAEYDLQSGIELKLIDEMNKQIDEINNSFQQKGEFETTEAFELRKAEKDEKIISIKQYYESKISDLKKEKETEFTDLKKQQDEKTNTIIDQSLRDTIVSITEISSYNADKQTFKITIKGITNEVFIPIDKAPAFKDNWKKATVKCKMQLTDDLKHYKFFDFIIIHPVTNEEIKFDSSK